MKRIAVVGAGAMGSGIAQVAAMAGHEVLIYDSFQGAIGRARDLINQSLNKLTSKGQFTDQESKAIFGRIYFPENFETLGECDLVIEAIIEDENEKKELFRKLSQIMREDAIIATNTSSLSVTSLANAVSLPGRFIGLHFFNPPVMMRLVEVIPALQTSESTVGDIVDLITSWQKICVLAKDTPGFIVNRIARPFYSEALRIAEEQLATPITIDAAMKEIGGFRMGPFELMDFIGNDVNAAVTHSVWKATHFEPRYKPSVMQENLVRAGWLGRKSGRGFYNYASDLPETNKDVEIIHAALAPFEIFERIIMMLINEAADAWYQGIASREDIDLAMTLGVNYPKGLLAWADEMGITNCITKLDALYDHYRDPRYRCSPGLRWLQKSERKFYI